MKTYTINFIRHAMTKSNINGSYAGAIDIPLCDKGIEKLLYLKSKYKYPKADLFFSSPLSRCIQTCKILYPDEKVQVLEDLREWNFGDWAGKTPDELLKDDKYVKWIESGRGSNFEIPNGESASEFGKRICKCFEQIVYDMVNKGITNANIFTHGGVIMTILATYSLPKSKFLDWAVDNGCGYSVLITPSLWMRDKIIEVYEKVPQGYSGEITGKFKKLLEGK